MGADEPTGWESTLTVWVKGRNQRHAFASVQTIGEARERVEAAKALGWSGVAVEDAAGERVEV